MYHVPGIDVRNYDFTGKCKKKPPRNSGRAQHLAAALFPGWLG
jgi:hypothetical protein